MSLLFKKYSKGAVFGSPLGNWLVPPGPISTTGSPHVPFKVGSRYNHILKAFDLGKDLEESIAKNNCTKRKNNSNSRSKPKKYKAIANCTVSTPKPKPANQSSAKGRKRRSTSSEPPTESHAEVERNIGENLDEGSIGAKESLEKSTSAATRDPEPDLDLDGLHDALS
jgi:hypothetical protein